MTNRKVSDQVYNAFRAILRHPGVHAQVMEIFERALNEGGASTEAIDEACINIEKAVQQRLESFESQILEKVEAKVSEMLGEPVKS